MERQNKQDGKMNEWRMVPNGRNRDEKKKTKG